MKNKNVVSLIAISLLLIGGFNSFAQRTNKAPENLFGIRVGFNMSDLTSANGLDVFNGLAFYNKNLEYVGFTDTKPFQYGFNVGATGQIKIADSWYVQPSLMFTTKGYKLNTQNKGYLDQNVEMDVKAYYLQLPIDLVWKYSFSDDARFIVQGGGFLGFGIAGESVFHDHYGEKTMPRNQHEQTPLPSIPNGFIGYDYTVHQLSNQDFDDTFMTEGTNRWDAGLELGLGFEYKRFQVTLSYQYSLTPLYDYAHDYTLRYKEKGIQNTSNSFQFLKQETPSSPSQHVISISFAYYLDLFSNKLKY
ncbi:MAG: PorT family protein [Bacteroidales bacterium]|nr:PorT family protein [Bacteroidales bacterium]